MQSKLTLRVEDTVIRKAKLLAKKRGTSVSRLFGEFITSQKDELPSEELPPLTSSMLGVIRREGEALNESDYQDYLEEKYR
jgi:hypothetical protein